MRTHDMNALVRALQSSLTRAQTGLDRRQERTIERMIDLAEDGSPEFVTWRCPSLSGDGQVRNHELLRIPWASLASPAMVGISELSVTLKHPGRFTMEKSGFKAIAGENSSDSRTDVQKGTASSIKIHLQGESGRTGNIVIDDVHVGTIGPKGRICETHVAGNEFEVTERRQEKVPRTPGRTRSVIIGLAAAIAALAIAGVAAWLIL